ncbi:hypothetical protein ARMA_0861 [Ardenticatena maritima]|uniref:Uncharacterized protein n=1 Tax=Ardenticatena maritima TaxID=872965 RepID=A0A0M9UC13_9CHLR|nr:hypothetical protein [Ardenticatena maritima]KPL88447.1 hypothetical protein SE16_06515 [Ardenticatena maritima]GAP62438.1 hypothetical protein ARMA_0861 [Ardenticatena maritima]
MTIFPPEWAETLRAAPQRRVAAIVRLHADAPEDEGLWKARGLHVRRRYRLMNAVAVEGPAAALLALADEPWVERIEPDPEVHL